MPGPQGPPPLCFVEWKHHGDGNPLPAESELMAKHGLILSFAALIQVFDPYYIHSIWCMIYKYTILSFKIYLSSVLWFFVVDP